MMAYTVVKGDTPSKIAAKLGVTVDKVMAVSSAFSRPGDARTLQIGAVIDLEATTPGAPPGTPRTSGAKDTYTGDPDTRFHGVAGAPQLWYNSTDGSSLLVFFVPGFEPPVPMTWRITDDEDLKALFGGQTVIYDRVYDDAELTRIGAIDEGIATEIDLTEGNPWEGWVELWERESKTRPYLLDPEIAALHAASALEGRRPSQAELEGTQWFQTHSGAEQQWLILEASNPVGAGQLRDANRRVIRQMLTSAGVYQPNDRITNFIADRWTMGQWTEQMAKDQINAVADPYYDSPLDVDLMGIIDDPDDPLIIDRNTDREEWVRSTARKWLGPVYGTLSVDQVRDIAGRLRNDPNYEEQWTSDLKGQRLALFPAYEDPERSYDEVAQPWRGVWFDIMGQEPDEVTSVFQDAVQGNDLYQGRSAIRRHGLDVGNQSVSQSFIRDTFRAFGGGARNLIQ
jgi:hypothetical protein